MSTSNTMDEYTALPLALYDIIPIMELTDDFKDRVYDLFSTDSIIYYKEFDDNSIALEVARLPEMR